jgi:hypothetical protein
MNQRPTIREQIDACRPDSDDLHLPEHAADLAELQGNLRESPEVRGDCERIQKNDRLIRSAMQDVSLPAGLEAKLLGALQAAQAVPLSGVERAIQEDPAAEEKLVTTVPAKGNRRLFIRVASGVVVAASVLVGIFVFLSRTPNEQPITKDELATQVEQWLRAVDVRAMAKPSKPIALPTGVLGTAVGSSSISSPQGKITAYSVMLRGSNATLLMVATTKACPVGSLPFTKIGVSGGWQVGAWQKGGVLYVIAVPENSGTRLDQFAPQQPIG